MSQHAAEMLGVCIASAVASVWQLARVVQLLGSVPRQQFGQCSSCIVVAAGAAAEDECSQLSGHEDVTAADEQSQPAALYNI